MAPKSEHYQYNEQQQQKNDLLQYTVNFNIFFTL